MKVIRVIPAIIYSLILATITSCGSGGGGTTASGGMGGTGISSGPITGFGSVFVNGVEFSTTGTVINMNGAPSTEGDLRVGMIVTVQGTFDANGSTGTANQIDFTDNLEGPIQIINAGTQSLVVMGQTVKTDTGTHYEGITGFNDLQHDNVIEVSGLPQSDGTVLATYIELKSPNYNSGDEIEVKGVVSGLDPNSKTFKIGDLVVDYNSASLENLPAGGLADGIYVEVQSTTGFDITGVFIASKVEGLGSGITGSEGTHVELEGFVSQFNPTPPVGFVVNGQPVSITSSTHYENGTSTNLENNVRVEVEGTLDANGVLIASRISFDD